MLKIKIPDMICPHCEVTVRKSIAKTGGKVLLLDLESKIVELETPLSRDELVATLSNIGFDVEICD